MWSLNNIAYPSLAFSMKRNDRDSLNTYSGQLAAYWKMNNITARLSDASLTEIGVGIWGSQTMIVTIVTIFTPLEVQK